MQEIMANGCMYIGLFTKHILVHLQILLVSENVVASELILLEQPKCKYFGNSDSSNTYNHKYHHNIVQNTFVVFHHMIF